VKIETFLKEKKMKTAKMLVILVLAFGLMMCVAKVSEAEPMGTAFTYQGRLLDANDVANGLYDFEFELYDAPSDGNQLGSTIDINDLDVIDGYFTVVLDFNEPNAFNGEARWLEIGVRPGDSNDPNDFVVLSPRQEVTPTPYAIYAARAGVDVPFSLTGSVGYPGAVFSVTNTGSGNGFYGEATGAGRGVYGLASNTGAVENYGGYFEAAGGNGSSVYGYASTFFGLSSQRLLRHKLKLSVPGTCASPLCNKVSIWAELLDTVVTGISHIDIAACVCGHACGERKVSITRASSSLPRGDKLPI